MLSQVHRWRHSSLPPDNILPQWLIHLKAPKSHLNICHCCIFLKVVTATLVSSWYLPFHYSSTTRSSPFIKKSCEIFSFPSFGFSGERTRVAESILLHQNRLSPILLDSVVSILQSMQIYNTWQYITVHIHTKQFVIFDSDLQ